MDEKDLTIQKLKSDHSKEMAKLSNRIIELAGEACFLCMKCGIERQCEECRVHKIKEEVS